MNSETIILAALNIFAGYFLWFFLFRRYFVDSHRHELFKLRYELFDYALENGIDFEHPAFKIRWNEINAMIRYTHETHLMFLSMIFSRRKISREVNNYMCHRQEALDQLDAEQRKFFENNRNEQLKLFYSYIIKSSLIFLTLGIIITLIISIVFLLFMLWKRTNIIKKILPHFNNVYDDYEYLAMKTI